MSNDRLAEGFGPYSRDDWLKLVEKALGGARFEDVLVSETLDGIRIEPIYGRDLLPAASLTAEPGAPPFTRGTTASRPDGRWDIRQLHADDDPAAVNAAILEDLAGGVTSVTLQLAVPGQAGLAPRYDVIARALAGVHLDMIGIAVMPGDQYLGAAQCLATLWDEAGVPESRRSGAINADPLGTLARAGALEDTVWSSLDVLAHFVAQGVGKMPLVTTLIADGRPYHDAGASQAEELASMLATAVEYLRALEGEQVRIDRSMAKLAFALSADCDQFLTIAKLRAARRLIWRVCEAAGNGWAAASARLHAETSQRMLARRDAQVNMLRATVAAAAAALGGADSISVLPWSWPLGRPDAAARRLARNTQLVLQEESGLGRVVDPAGGSGYVESLTDQLARKAWGLFQDIEQAGGMARALMSGMIADRIAATAERRRASIANGTLKLVGVTAFPVKGETLPALVPHPAPAPIERAATRIDPLPLRRDAAPFEEARS